LISQLHLTLQPTKGDLTLQATPTHRLNNALTKALKENDFKALNLINETLPHIKDLDPTQPHEGPIQNPYGDFGVRNEEWFAFQEVRKEIADEGRDTHLSHVFAFSQAFLNASPPSITFPKEVLPEVQTLTKALPSTTSLKTQHDWLARQDEASIRHIYHLGTHTDQESLALIKNTLTTYENGAYLLEKLQERYANYGLFPSEPSSKTSPTQLDIKG